jgi:hypothetical protein
MLSIEDRVGEVVVEFMANKQLFTALDVSNVVKVTHPLARHREVRDIVRGLFSQMETNGYARTPINVQLADNSTREALLYHDLLDSWDLDVKYDAQKRAQQLTNPMTSVVTPAATPVVGQLSAVVHVKKAATVKPALVSTKPQSVTTPTAAPSPTVKQIWDNLFTPSRLFPKF